MKAILITLIVLSVKILKLEAVTCGDVDNPVTATNQAQEFYIGTKGNDIGNTFTCTVNVNNDNVHNIIVTVTPDKTEEAHEKQCVTVKNQKEGASPAQGESCTTGVNKQTFTSDGGPIEISFSAPNTAGVKAFKVTYKLDISEEPTDTVCGDGTNPLTATNQAQEFYIGTKGNDIGNTFTCTVNVNNDNVHNIIVTVTPDKTEEAHEKQCVTVKNQKEGASPAQGESCTTGVNKQTFTSDGGPIEISFSAPNTAGVKAFKVTYKLEEDGGAHPSCITPVKLEAEANEKTFQVYPANGSIPEGYSCSWHITTSDGSPVIITLSDGQGSTAKQCVDVHNNPTDQSAEKTTICRTKTPNSFKSSDSGVAVYFPAAGGSSNVPTFEVAYKSMSLPIQLNIYLVGFALSQTILCL